MTNKGKSTSTVGLRNTIQRTAILKVIRKRGTHLSPYEIYRLAKREQPSLTLATVYRTMNKLKNLNLVEEIHINETHHYEIKPPFKHHHLICIDCGKIVEFKYDLVGQIKKKVPEAREFEITSDEVRITGFCATCQAKN